MSAFTTSLDIRDNLDGTWTVLNELVYLSDTRGRFVVEPGFVTDFASTPQVIWWLMPAQGERYDAAAVLHDRLYRTHVLPQAECDAVFLEAMLACGVGWLRAHTMYRALRMFGGFAYRNQPKAK